MKLQTPRGFQKAKAYPAFADPESGAWVQARAIEVPFAMVSERLARSGFVAEGSKLLEEERLKVGRRPALLVTGTEFKTMVRTSKRKPR